jgi:hypothetical protein
MWKPRKRVRRFKRNLTWLHEWEHSIILRDLIEMGGEASNGAMRLRYPMRYHQTGLTLAFKRMREQGLLKHAPHRGTWVVQDAGRARHAMSRWAA